LRVSARNLRRTLLLLLFCLRWRPGYKLTRFLIENPVIEETLDVLEFLVGFGLASPFRYLLVPGLHHLHLLLRASPLLIARLDHPPRRHAPADMNRGHRSLLWDNPHYLERLALLRMMPLLCNLIFSSVHIIGVVIVVVSEEYVVLFLVPLLHLRDVVNAVCLDLDLSLGLSLALCSPKGE